MGIPLWILAVLIIGQVISLAWALLRKPVVSATNPATPPAVRSLPDSPVTPSTASAGPIVAETEAPSAPAEPAKESLDTPITNPTVLFYFEAGLSAREHGDMVVALRKLQAARDLLPAHPRVLYEVATTYEKMGQDEKAQPIWDEIYRLGPAAGGYFQVAEMKFQAAGLQQPREIKSQLQLGKILARRDTDPLSAEKVTVRIPVQARDGAAVDPARVNIVVSFFEKNTGTGTVDATDRESTHHWLNGAPSWTSHQVEFLDAVYSRPKASTGEIPFTSEPPQTWQYYGFLVKLYYDNQLQDVVAEPKELVRRDEGTIDRPLRNAVDRPIRGPGSLPPVENSLLPPID